MLVYTESVQKVFLSSKVHQVQDMVIEQYINPNFKKLI